MDSKPLLSRFLWYLNMVKAVFNDVRSKMHVCEMGVASIVAACPKTITSLVEFNSAHGNPALNHRNWSASYRLLSTCKWGLEELSWVLLDSALEFIGADEPVMLAVDDTLLRKTGRRIRGCAYARDPLSPPFQANLVWGQRILCVSVLVRSSATSAYRAVPVFFLHVPSVRIPANATQEEMEKLVEMQKKSRMSAVARRLLEAIRKHLDENGLAGRKLVVCADASFSNRAFLYGRLHDTAMVGRCRNDLRLVRPLGEKERTGKRLYGERLPTPDDMYKDGGVAENKLECGVMHQRASITYKSMEDVRWPTALLNQPCSVFAIRGQCYRKYGRRQHTHPAFLVMTGNVARGETVGVAPEVLLEAYLLRWEIEVGFRDQKNWLGIGKAQVRNTASVKRTPAFMSACYSLLLMASMKAFDDKRTADFGPLPKWRTVAPLRPSIRDLTRLLRKEVIELGRVPA
ncbi:MAG: transposase [Victivallales bacterium]|nr:transposase [Victivallales bacterium]